MQPPAFTSLEKAGQFYAIRFVCAEVDGVDASGTEQPSKIRLSLCLALVEGLASALIASVDLHHLTGFGIRQNQPAQRRQLQFESISNLDGDNVMTTVDLAKHCE